VTVNHDQTFYALPKVLDRGTVKSILPDFLQKAYDRGLLVPATDQPTADEVELTPKEVQRLYQVFEAWASVNWQMLKEWLEFTVHVQRIVHGRFIDEGDLNRWIRSHFWGKRPAGWLTKCKSTHQIPNDSLQFAFDMVVRAAQYHVAFGAKRAYQPHPIRSLYTPRSSTTSAQDVDVSWGWLLIKEIEHCKGKWDSGRLLGTINDLQGHLQDMDATTCAMVGDDQITRREKLNSVAVALGVRILPHSVDRLMEGLSKLVGMSIEVIGEIYKIPFLGIGWEIVSIPIKRGADSALQNCSYVQRRVAFPGTASYRPKVESIQAKLQW
jgi:hypothetical protein